MVLNMFLQSGWIGGFASFLLLLVLGANLIMSAWPFTDAFDWERKGQSPMMWSVVVFFLSVPGFFLYLMLGRETTSSHSRQP